MGNKAYRKVLNDKGMEPRCKRETPRKTQEKNDCRKLSPFNDLKLHDSSVLLTYCSEILQDCNEYQSSEN